MADKEHVAFVVMKKEGKPMRPGDVGKITGTDSKEVSKIINDLKKKGKVSSPKKVLLRAG